MDCTRDGTGALESDSDNRKGRKMMMEWNGVVAMGTKRRMRRKYVERTGKIFGDKFMGDKQGERDKADLPGFQCKLGER